jgi:hypothetical protein
MKEDKLKILFPNPEQIFDFFHIDFQTGKIYDRKLWDKGYEKEVGRPAWNKTSYTRISVTKDGKSIDVLAHRLIYYAYHKELPILVDHIKEIKNKDAIFNLRASNTKLNRLKEEKIKRRKKSKTSKVSKKYVGIMKRYSYWWPFYKGNFISDKGFATEELALNCRNQFLLKEYGDYAKENIVNIDKNILIEHQKLQDLEEQKQTYINKHNFIKVKKQIKNDS